MIKKTTMDNKTQYLVICDRCGKSHSIVFDSSDFPYLDEEKRYINNLMKAGGNDWRLGSRKYGKSMTLCPDCFYGKKEW